MNCINPILIDGEGNSTLLENQVLPKLQLIECSVMQSCAKHLENIWSAIEMNKLYADLNIKTGQQRGKFIGNPCRSILKNWNFFYDKLPVEFKFFGECLQRHHIVVKSCFGSVLNTAFEQDIQSFKEIYTYIIKVLWMISEFLSLQKFT